MFIFVAASAAIPIAVALSPYVQVPLKENEPFQEAQPTFDWNQVSPSKHLRYTTCYGGLKCARLDVPLNWNTADQRDRAAIAVVKIPAKVPVTDERYGGAVLMNPGGPGESGIHQVVSGGRYIQSILDAPANSSSEVKYFDVIGFDPRLVGYSTPHMKCFPDAANQQSWLTTLPDYAYVWDSDATLGVEWARSEALGRSCATGGAVRFGNTPQTVEDMVALIESHGEWRQEEARRLTEEHGKQHTADGIRAVEERTSWIPGQEKLQYIGLSYGSLLGQTFAAMHPDRVSRLVIDGVLDPDDYYRGSFLKNLQDADGAMSKLCTYCFDAGPAKCALYTGASGSDVERRVEDLVFGLKSNPISVPATGAGFEGPEIVTFGDIMLQAIAAMAFPYKAAEPFFTMLAGLEKGNVSAFAATKQSLLKMNPVSSRCREEGPFSDACMSDKPVGLLGANQAIECMDSWKHRSKNFTKDNFKTYLAELRNQSKWFSESWARHRLNCVGIDDEPAWPFDGTLIAGYTSHPLLIIGNTHDTVTPIRNAHRVSTLFPGSVVLQHDSEGHCSFANPSVCTAQALRQYFQAGTLPQPGTICPPEYRPFVGCLRKQADGKCEKKNDDDERLSQALKGLTSVWP